MFSFFVTAVLTGGLSVLLMFNQDDHSGGAWVKRVRDMTRGHQVLVSVAMKISDIQIVTLIALLTLGLLRTCELNVYHYDLAAMMAATALATNYLSWTTLHGRLRQSIYTLVARLTGLSVAVVLFVPFMALFARMDAWDLPRNTTCYFEHSSSVESTYKPPAQPATTTQSNRTTPNILTGVSNASRTPVPEALSGAPVTIDFNAPAIIPIIVLAVAFAVSGISCQRNWHIDYRYAADTNIIVWGAMTVLQVCGPLVLAGYCIYRLVEIRSMATALPDATSISLKLNATMCGMPPLAGSNVPADIWGLHAAAANVSRDALWLADGAHDRCGFG